MGLKFNPNSPIKIGIFSDTGLAPTGCQAIIWINDGQFTDAYIRHAVQVSYVWTYIM